MADSTTRPGGRRGVVVAAATAVLAITGATLLAIGAFDEGNAPPVPPPAAAGAPASPPSGPSAGDVDGQQPAHPTHGPPRALGRSEPAALDIPAIDVHTEDLVPLGKQRSGRIEVPDLRAEDTVGWYEHGPWPGQFGPAVLGGHVDSQAGPAIFFRLGDLRAGDEVIIRRADGKTAVFTIYSVERFAKDDFPTREIYAPTNDNAELRLITCGGVFNAETGHYRDNVAAFAKLTDTR